MISRCSTPVCSTSAPHENVHLTTYSQNPLSALCMQRFVHHQVNIFIASLQGGQILVILLNFITDSGTQFS